MRITIIGCGSIGSKLAKAADEMKEVRRIYLMDIKKGTAANVAAALSKADVIESLDDELYHSDLVIEAASQDAARDILPRVVARGVDIMIMSVGALVDDDFRNTVFEKAHGSEAKIYIPTGALCGVDGLNSASVEVLDEVELISMKGPRSLLGVKYIEDKGIDVMKITERTTIYSGYAREAVKLFPRNVNVAATVSLLGIGFDKTKVTVVVDPEIKSNSHELRVAGSFGTMNCHTYNVPEPDNPATSHLATLSAIAAMKRIVRKEWFGI
jgi:aspartate dehydrogenase